MLTDAADLRVLIVDDQEHVRTWVRAVLTSVGVTDITEASDGSEAVSAVTQPGGWFDIVLCDLRMPERDGIETLRAFAALGVQSGVAIMSGEDERVIDTAALLTEAHGLRLLGTIQKPITVEKLEKLLARLRSGGDSQSPHVVLAPAADLENAFARREMQLVYQPKVSLSTGRLVGVEALIRWKHPEFGVFQPNAFVPLIEGSAEYSAWLIEYTLLEAIACAGRAQSAGRDLNVAVNLSRRAFDRLDLPEWIDGVCAEHHVPAGNITLEITETAVAHDAVRLLDVATRLRLRGFALSIDDFGTGESGLSQLKRLPFTELKIDREFVDGCSRSMTQRSVVEASLSLARSLNMTAVAEGVQQRADWEALLTLGCDVVQGYFVAAPMGEEHLGQWEGRRLPFRTSGPQRHRA
ncbi:MAG TPA: EAL domain-containing response regulator [Gemmatimonadaceae bacterium]|nr:EAL domain-containing response regulator [Gemmatimonadaceae bacterium]